MEKLLDIFQNATWQAISGAKTYVQEDAPEQTVYAIRSFLSDR